MPRWIKTESGWKNSNEDELVPGQYEAGLDNTPGYEKYLV